MSKLKVFDQNFNRETGITTFSYRYKNYTFTGVAYCHEDDMDMCSELVGLKYAETRAYLQYLKVRKRELELRYETISGLYKNLATSKDFDHYTKYAKKLSQALNTTQEELNECRDALKNIPPYLKEDIAARDKLYKSLRKRRENAK